MIKDGYSLTDEALVESFIKLLLTCLVPRNLVEVDKEGLIKFSGKNFKPLTIPEIPVPRSKTQHRCDIRRHDHIDDRKKLHLPVP